MASPIEQPEMTNADVTKVEVTGTKSGISGLALTMSLVVGVYFGIVLTKSEVVRWQRVHDMFLFNEAFMYLIIVSELS